MNIQLDDGRGYVYQWETGRFIRLVDFTSCDKVYFSNPESDEAYVVATTSADGVLKAQIPNELLQLDKKIKLYCNGLDDGGRYIQLDAVIPLVPRQRPANYVYEPTETMTFEGVLEEVSDMKDDVSQMKSDVNRYKNDSAKSAANAKSSEDLAERYAKGTVDGVAVTSGEGYQDNAKYYKEEVEKVIEEGLSEYNENASDKTTAFDKNAADKTSTFNENASDATNEFNENVTQKTKSFDDNVALKTNTFNDNVTQQTSNFNENATYKTAAFDQHVTEKETELKGDLNSHTTDKKSELNTHVAETSKPALDAYETEKEEEIDSHVSEKLTEFNDNASGKTTSFNENATEKTNSFNNNASQKTNNFNANVNEKQSALENSLDEYVAGLKESEIDPSVEEATSKASEASDSAILSKSWATKIDGPVDGTEYSAKKYAQDAEQAKKDAQAIVGTELTPDRVLVSNADGKFTASGVTTTKLGYLSDVTSAIQTQLNNKLGKTEKAQSAGTADKWATARTLTIGGDGSGSVSLDGSGNVTLSLTVKRYNPPGTMLWYFGTLASVPEGYLICNGSAYSRTTHAALFAAIGTKYGAGDGSTTFNVPNLSDGNGRFIRAGFSDDVIGTKLDDAIRNIRGRLGAIAGFTGNALNDGLLFYNEGSKGSCNGNDSRRIIYFDASRVVSTATENRPYSFRALPLIAY